jgi:ABC-type phosphate/phosphonate transport system substrate-binding protein
LRAIAAPVPSPPRYAGLPRYCSEFLVRQDSGWTSIEQTFGHRFGWMADNSQSGFNGPRAYLSTFLTPERRTLFSESRGPFFTPARLLAALRQGDVDVVAVDSFFLDLCRLRTTTGLTSLRTVGCTPWAPIPLLVAAPGIPVATVDELRTRLVGIREEPAYAPLLADVLLDGFAVPQLEAYHQLEYMAQFAVDRGYAQIR